MVRARGPSTSFRCIYQGLPVFFGICTPCLIGEKCLDGQREQDIAQLKACSQMQNLTSNDVGKGYIVAPQTVLNTTMIIPGTNVNTTYIPPNMTDQAFVCFNFQVRSSDYVSAFVCFSSIITLINIFGPDRFWYDADYLCLL